LKGGTLMENWKLFLDEHLKTVSYDDVINVTGQGIFAVIHYLQAYEVWLERRAAEKQGAEPVQPTTAALCSPEEPAHSKATS
jgi:hypothetical protein